MVVSALGSQTAAAVEAPVESITMSPASSKLQLEAGTTYRDELTILNDGTVAYDFILYARPYSIQHNDYEKPDFTGTPPNADAYRWVQFEESKWRIEPGQTLKIPYSLRVPAEAAPGGHYGVIFAETQPTQPSGGASVARKKRVGSLLYVTVKGEYITGGQLLAIDTPWLQFRPPLASAVMVENTGNADFDTTIDYKVTDVFGGVKYREIKQYVVLPKTIRSIAVEWSGVPWFGLFRTTTSITYLDKTESKHSVVLVAPRWLLLTVLLFAVGGGVYAVFRRRKT